MMAGLFLIFAFALGAIWLGYRKVAIGLIAIALLLSIVMFKEHATDILQIMW